MPSPSRHAPPPPRYRGKLARARADLNPILARHIRYSADGRKVVSHATINDRHKFFSKMLRDLHALDYRLSAMANFKPKHVRALAGLWESQNLSASSLQKRFSYLRLLCVWIGKPGMVGDPAQYLRNPERYRRVYVAERDKSWRGQGVDDATVIARVAAKDPQVALMLRLIAAFGLRPQEASLFRPKLDDRGEVIHVSAGTKGGRPRTVPVETDEQRAVLADAHRCADQTGRSLIPARYTLKQWLRHVYYVLDACGVNRKSGLVAHGGRHGYANDLFETLTGERTAVRGGDGGRLTREQERAARLVVSERLGHSRPGITSNYYGPVMTARRAKKITGS